MTNEELDMHWIPAPLAARALGVMPRTLHVWLDAGQIASKATITRRRWVSVAGCRAFLRERTGKAHSAEENMFDKILREEELPVSPFLTNDTSTGVLVS